MSRTVTGIRYSVVYEPPGDGALAPPAEHLDAVLVRAIGPTYVFVDERGARIPVQRDRIISILVNWQPNYPAHGADPQTHGSVGARPRGEGAQ